MKFRKVLCAIGLHGPDLFGAEWGRCGEPFVRQCPHCGMRWYGQEIENRDYRYIGDWRTREWCIKHNIWAGDKVPNQKY